MRLLALLMTISATLFASLGIILSLPAQAQKQPIRIPATDYDAEYRMDGEMDGTMLFRFARDPARVRVEIAVQGQKMVAVHDLKGRVSRMWSPAMAGMIMRVDGDRQSAITGDPTADTRLVLGEKCLVWKTSGGDVCLAKDGVPLAFSGRNMKAEAVRLERRPQPAAAFDLPKGQEMPLKIGQGMKLPMPF
jgi:hypothetical protein